VEKIIHEEFFVDHTRSVNKRQILKVNEFGYLSTHLIVKVHDKRRSLPEWTDFKDIWCEVQIRTVLEHAWAVASHEVDYKGEIGIPSQLKRTLIQLSGMLENVDQQLSTVIGQARGLRNLYRDQIAQEDLNIEINIDSLTAYLNSSSAVQQWLDFIASLCVTNDSSGATPREIEMAQVLGLHTIADIDVLLRQSWPWAKSILQEYLPAGATMNRNGVILYLLVANFADKFTEEEMNLKWGWSKGETFLQPSIKYNPKFHHT
jgi:putative GTP pyrophosphokinase